MVITAILSFLFVGIFTSLSRRRGWGQTVRAEVSQHQGKQGTPTAGGIGFVLAMVVGYLLMGGTVTDPREPLILLAALGMGLIGLVDDLLKIRSRARGSGKSELKAREKFPLQIAVALVFAIFAAPLASHDLLPSLGRILDIALFTFVMVGSVNAFNFTDGVDGLLAGVAIIVLLPLLVLSPVTALLVAALLGFLWFNAHPAKVFMGDMGSHAIGAVAAGAYILYADAWALPVAAIIPVVAMLSVIAQVLYFRRTGGKRLFKMSPIHHHFELSGWSESQVAVRFWVVTGVFTALTWWLLGGRL